MTKIMDARSFVDSGAKLPPVLEKVATYSGANLPSILVESLPLFR